MNLNRITGPLIAMSMDGSRRFPPGIIEYCLVRTQDRDAYLIIWIRTQPTEEVPPTQFEHLDRNFNTPVGFTLFIESLIVAPAEGYRELSGRFTRIRGARLLPLTKGGA